MQSKVKLTKRQVKEDKFTTFMLNTRTQVTDNWQFLVIGLVAVLVLVAAVVWYVNNQNEKTVEAEGKLSEAISQYQAGNNQVAILGFTNLMDEYGGTMAARTATYYLGNLYLSSRNFEDAIATFRKYLDKHDDNTMERAAAYGGMAAAYEGQADFVKAAEYYIKAVNESPDGPLEADYRYGAVRNYVQTGDMEAAKAQVDTLKEKLGGTDSAKRAERLYAEKQQS